MSDTFPLAFNEDVLGFLFSDYQEPSVKVYLPGVCVYKSDKKISIVGKNFRISLNKDI